MPHPTERVAMSPLSLFQMENNIEEIVAGLLDEDLASAAAERDATRHPLTEATELARDQLFRSSARGIV